MSADPPLRAAVCVVLEDPQGRHLLVRRAAGRSAAGYWTPVTGKLEVGETPGEAAAREVFEEVGLFVNVPDDSILARTPTEGDGRGFELLWIRATLAPGADVTLRLSSEVAEARWLTRTELLTLTPMFPSTRAFFA